MKSKQFFLAMILLFSTSYLFSQNENDIVSQTSYSYYAQKFYLVDEKTEQRYVYSDVVNVRNGASTAFETIDKLACGQEVSIVEVIEKEEKINGIVANWLKINYQKDRKIVEGYIWGGNLSYRQLRRGEVKFVFGLERAVKEKNTEESTKWGYTFPCLAGIKAIKGGKIVSYKNFKITTDTEIYFSKITDNQNFTDIEFLIEIVFGGGGCGIPTEHKYFVWDKKELLFFIETMSVGDADVYGYSEDLFFSKDFPDTVVKVFSRYEKEDFENSEEYTENYKTELYHWNGKELIKIEQKWE